MMFNEKYQHYLEIFEDYLSKVMQNLDGHKKLIDAMKYSLFAGGKRVRPVLMLATTEMLGGNLSDALPFALAVECVHTYSLIHDDLPAMDNDDLRRGQPTSHKVFGEDFAILAGDALLNFAFEHSLKAVNSPNGVRAVLYLAECSGYSGMVGGQAYDINPILDGEKQLLVTDALKTAKLISAPLKMAAILFSGDEDALETFGEKLGIIYQFVDDVLDSVGDEKKLGKATGKDLDAGKVNAVAVYGLSGATKRIDELEKQAKDALKNVPNNEFLLEFLSNSVKRTW